ncbi:hypothetical protein EYF80_026967 [Liparis tanakae]|uniref:Uncharacterized protein n=1 Tax=Liparis tanakae TaxID=230148 RepID=A0A4Z2HDM8_9TELE|nr:hypothetical protein EYF80_026967 [Liparis tanakae]
MLDQTHREMSEDLESGAQEVDQVHEVSRGAAVGLSHAPLVVRQLDELIDLLVELGLLQVGGVDDDLHQLQEQGCKFRPRGCLVPAVASSSGVGPTSVSPMWGFLMRFCRQLLSVLVRSRLVDFRNMSSISVELETTRKISRVQLGQSHIHNTEADRQEDQDRAGAELPTFSISASWKGKRLTTRRYSSSVSTGMGL